jgi:DNA mismatch repair protein MutS2
MITVDFEQKKAVGLDYIISKLEASSAYGQEKIKNLKLYSPDKKQSLKNELDNINKVIATLESHSSAYSRLLHNMSMMNNIKRTIDRIDRQILDDVELFEIKCFLLQCEKIKEDFDSINIHANFIDIYFEDTTDALNIVDPEKTRIASFYISDACSDKLRELRAKKAQVERQISLTSKDSAASLISRHTELSKQEEEEELSVRKTLTQALMPHIYKMAHNAEQIGVLDLLIAKAKLAAKLKGVMPLITDKTDIIVKNMFNPQLKESKGSFTPISMQAQSGVTVITGANMGGKSVAIKTLALNVMLAQMGFFVFAEHFETPLFEFFSFFVADAEKTEKGLSTFGGEIVRLNETFKKVKKSFGLVIMDEFAKGTNMTEGQSIFAAVVQALNAKSSITVMTTHYDEVAKQATRHYQVMGLKPFDSAYTPSQNAEENIRYLAARMNYGLKEVPLNQPAPKEAIAVCTALGLDEEILNNIRRY